MNQRYGDVIVNYPQYTVHPMDSNRWHTTIITLPLTYTLNSSLYNGPLKHRIEVFQLGYPTHNMLTDGFAYHGT